MESVFDLKDLPWENFDLFAEEFATEVVFFFNCDAVATFCKLECG
jgi:hypothetical protein